MWKSSVFMCFVITLSGLQVAAKPHAGYNGEQDLRDAGSEETQLISCWLYGEHEVILRALKNQPNPQSLHEKKLKKCRVRDLIRLIRQRNFNY